MAEVSKIEWTDATWNPITGCTLVDEGCRNCYAADLAGTRLKNIPSRKGLAVKRADGSFRFTGEVRFNEQWLDQPLRWHKPRMIFVCAHGDLFHPNVPDEWIDRVFAVMALARHHTFQVLTKRPERARTYFDARRDGDPWAEAADWLSDLWGWESHAIVLEPEDIPLPNVWLGTSISDQAGADARIPHLLAAPAAVRFLSAEPLLDRVEMRANWLRPDLRHTAPPSQLDWIIVGGESGNNAREMNPEWARSLRDQSYAHGVTFFMKQMARKGPIPPDLMVREIPGDRR